MRVCTGQAPRDSGAFYTPRPRYDWYVSVIVGTSALRRRTFLIRKKPSSCQKDMRATVQISNEAGPVGQHTQVTVVSDAIPQTSEGQREAASKMLHYRNAVMTPTPRSMMGCVRQLEHPRHRPGKPPGRTGGYKSGNSALYLMSINTYCKTDDLGLTSSHRNT